MSRRSRLAWTWVLSILGLTAFLVLGAILVAWVRSTIRRRIRLSPPPLDPPAMVAGGLTAESLSYPWGLIPTAALGLNSNSTELNSNNGGWNTISTLAHSSEV